MGEVCGSVGTGAIGRRGVMVRPIVGDMGLATCQNFRTRSAVSPYMEQSETRREKRTVSSEFPIPANP